MSGVISESYLSRPFTLAVFGQSGRELVYDVTGTDDEEEVRTLLEATAPASYLGRVIDSFEAEPVGPGFWKGRAKYIRFLDDSEYTFDTTGGTFKRTQALATIASYAPPGMTAPDFKGVIGVTDDGVEGVEVVSPAFKFSETHRFTDVFILAGYKVILFNLTGKVNNASFKGLNAGECLFSGASGSKRGDEQWTITFNFSASPNATGLTAGDITGIDKLGQDYVWFRYGYFEDTGALARVPRPTCATVVRIQPQGDFSTLGIGV